MSRKPATKKTTPRKAKAKEPGATLRLEPKLPEGAKIIGRDDGFNIVQFSDGSIKKVSDEDLGVVQTLSAHDVNKLVSDAIEETNAARTAEIGLKNDEIIRLNQENGRLSDENAKLRAGKEKVVDKTPPPATPATKAKKGTGK